MFVPFLIMLREGVEAALIVGIIASYLVQTGRGRALNAVWLGVGAACLLCLATGLGLHRAAAEFPQKAQELFEAAVGLLAAIILTLMVFWMREAAQSIKAQLHGRVDEALSRAEGGGLALAGMAFLAVAREGLESVVFLMAAFSQEDLGWQPALGACLGLLAAVAIGVAVFRFGRRLDLRRFFRWTGVLILFVAAGLLAGALRSAHEAGLWNGLQATAYDLSEILPLDSLAGTLLAGLFGYRDAPSLGELLLYLAFLLPALALFLRPAAAGRRAEKVQNA